MATRQQRRLYRKPKDPKLDLHKLLDESEMLKIHEAFDQEEGKRMNREQLREVLWRAAKIDYEEDKFNQIFMRMNSQW